MNNWEETYTEQNAKAEMIGAFLTMIFFGIPLGLLFFFILLLAFFG